MQRLTSENRKDVFIIDDTLFARCGYKCTEMVARVFDHADMRYRKGFRLLTLGWSDGNSFLPINFSLLSSQNERNQLGVMDMKDGRTIAGKRRAMAVRKATDVMLELLREALRAGHQAKYVLFDTWFANPHQIVSIKDMGLDVIAMVKKSSKRGVTQAMKNSKFWKMIKKFIEEENAEEYNGDTVGMYIGGTIGTLMMVAMILYGGM